MAVFLKEVKKDETVRPKTIALVTMTISIPGQSKISVTVNNSTLEELRDELALWLFGKTALKAHKCIQFHDDSDNIGLSDMVYFGLNTGLNAIVEETFIIENHPVSLLTVK